MNVNVISCSECGAPLRIAEGQFLTSCKFCDVKYYVKQDFPPAITIRDNIKLADAKKIVLDELRHREVSKGFLSNSYFESGTLFFIPLIEIRGIKARTTSKEISGKSEYGYTAYDYIEHGSHLTDLEIDFIDSSIIENSLLDADQGEYDVNEMRKRGVVLPLKPDFNINEKTGHDEHDIVEKHVRIIYFPVWEINYSYSGIVFKSYVSAIDGRPIKVQAIKNHRKKLIFSILGIFSIAILMARGSKFILIFFTGAEMGMEASRIMFWFFLLGALITLILSSFLIPFFWEMFAFREIISIRQDGVESRLINYSDNNLMRFLRGFLDKAGKLFSVGKSDDG
ncbi:MAG: hypothetical protein ABFR36_02695 [Acidobacteriota bacterium]